MKRGVSQYTTSRRYAATRRLSCLRSVAVSGRPLARSGLLLCADSSHPSNVIESWVRPQSWPLQDADGVETIGPFGVWDLMTPFHRWLDICCCSPRFTRGSASSRRTCRRCGCRVSHWFNRYMELSSLSYIWAVCNAFESAPSRQAATALTVCGTLGIGAATAVLTLLSGSIYSVIGPQGFWVMAALCAAALLIARRL